MSLAVAKTRSRRSMTAFRELSELAGFVNCQPLQVAAIEGAAPRTTSPSGRGRHEPTSAALISRPRSCRSDSHTGKDLPNRRDATAPAQESTSPGHRRPIPRRASNPTTLKLPREGSQCRGPAARCRRIALCSQIARATPRLRCHADGGLSPRPARRRRQVALQARSLRLPVCALTHRHRWLARLASPSS